ncbi:uncharacterized protein LOC129779138 [Toxorhynchites rutilus septentrionalis]|uniref:uncharacterized protein LOC129779138 n=1 Tax=Toxorhynchites rutilus septentrionalis TaxID=329112 RepID=UPI0024785CE9|nr:uncharacterized protein LOC129779138 [Toxorhynchites rutilus septentrionalis]XP_055642395.1 uncharacterized protein LOC129779138 [Toxorhynchites rutilus septentrionalis]XP_055642397.1 uncharacterized protein LOC129779138 [Toxorhynchites rutilus septentrionalis]
MLDKQVCLRWGNHKCALATTLPVLLEKQALVDCTLAAGGRFLSVHKFVLSACSTYFEALVSQNYDKHPVFLLKDVTFDDLHAIVDYMYRGEVNLAQKNLSSFLRTAGFLEIKGLSGCKDLLEREKASDDSTNAVEKAARSAVENNIPAQSVASVSITPLDQMRKRAQSLFVDRVAPTNTDIQQTSVLTQSVATTNIASTESSSCNLLQDIILQIEGRQIYDESTELAKRRRCEIQRMLMHPQSQRNLPRTRAKTCDKPQNQQQEQDCAYNLRGENGLPKNVVATASNDKHPEDETVAPFVSSTSLAQKRKRAKSLFVDRVPPIDTDIQQPKIIKQFGPGAKVLLPSTIIVQPLLAVEEQVSKIGGMVDSTTKVVKSQQSGPQGNTLLPASQRDPRRTQTNTHDKGQNLQKKGPVETSKRQTPQPTKSVERSVPTNMVSIDSEPVLDTSSAGITNQPEVLDTQELARQADTILKPNTATEGGKTMRDMVTAGDKILFVVKKPVATTNIASTEKLSSSRNPLRNVTSTIDGKQTEQIELVEGQQCEIQRMLMQPQSKRGLPRTRTKTCDKQQQEQDYNLRSRNPSPKDCVTTASKVAHSEAESNPSATSAPLDSSIPLAQRRKRAQSLFFDSVSPNNTEILQPKVIKPSGTSGKVSTPTITMKPLLSLQAQVPKIGAIVSQSQQCGVQRDTLLSTSQRDPRRSQTKTREEGQNLQENDPLVTSKSQTPQPTRSIERSAAINITSVDSEPVPSSSIAGTAIQARILGTQEGTGEIGRTQEPNMVTVGGKIRFVCPECGVQFPKKPAIQNHMKRCQNGAAAALQMTIE